MVFGRFNSLKDFLQHQAETDPLSKAVNSLLAKSTGTTLTGAEKEANAFTAQMSQEAQAFEERMAQKQMDFQAQQSATSWQRGVADMQAAGLNPALAYGQGGASSMQGISASGFSGSSVNPNTSGLSDILQVASFSKQLEKLDSEIQHTNAQTELLGKESEYKGLEIGMFTPLSEAKLKQVDSQLQTEAVERRLKESGISVNEAQRSLLEKNALLAGIDSETRGYLNQLEARQRVAQIGLTYQNTAESRKRLSLIDSQITETFQRAVTEAAQAGVYDQQTMNLLKESGILDYDADIKQYQASKKKLSFVLDCVGKTLGAVGSAALTFGAVGAGAKAFGLIGSASSASSGMPFKSDAFTPLINSQRYGSPY